MSRVGPGIPICALQPHPAMTHVIDLPLAQQSALKALREADFGDVEVVRWVLFGSVARGEATEDSDLDVLALTARPTTRAERHRITDAAFEVNLRYGTSISTLVTDEQNWTQGLLSVLPVAREVERDGIEL